MQQYEALENELAVWIGCDKNQIVACSSGTAALHLALEALRVPRQVKRSDTKQVICPNYTMIACPLSISLSGMIPVFVDCNERLLINNVLLERAITSKTVAIMLVHIYGRLCDTQAIQDVADKYGIYVIEDMAEAHGCLPHPNTQVACWSFYKNKIVHGEEGGCVYFKSSEMAQLARQLRNVGFTEAHDYNHIPYGHNYRMSNIHARLIRESLDRFNQEFKRRRILEDRYNYHCRELYKMPYRDSPWVYDICIPQMTEAKQSYIIGELKREGIEARHGFKPMTIQKQFEMCNMVGDRQSKTMANQIILLPLGENIIDNVPERAMKIIDKFA